MSIACPKTPREVPSVTTVWKELATFDQEDGFEDLDDEEIARTLFIDKTRLLDAVSVIQASIAYRAVRACRIYFDWMKKRSGTDKMTYLRPRVRIDSRYQTVEMSWVRRLSKTSIAKPGDKPSKGNVGRSFQIKTDKGTLTVFTWYEYLKKGQKDRYSNQIFKDEPAWVQKLGSEIEDAFEALRKEQKTLTAIRRSISGLDQIQRGRFSETTLKDLQEWAGHSLQSLYAPDIDLKSPSSISDKEED